MASRTTYLYLLMGCFAANLVYSCKQKPLPQSTVARPVNTFSVKGGVREMTLWPETIEFPEHPGKTEFVSYCGICHSLKYITAQPDFSRKIWEAEVHKMVVKYNAPIDSEKCVKITDYLVAIKGAK